MLDQMQVSLYFQSLTVKLVQCRTTKGVYDVNIMKDQVAAPTKNWALFMKIMEFLRGRKMRPIVFLRSTGKTLAVEVECPSARRVSSPPTRRKEATGIPNVPASAAPNQETQTTDVQLLHQTRGVLYTVASGNAYCPTSPGIQSRIKIGTRYTVQRTRKDFSKSE